MLAHTLASHFSGQTPATARTSRAEMLRPDFSCHSAVATALPNCEVPSAWRLFDYCEPAESLAGKVNSFT